MSTAHAAATKETFSPSFSILEDTPVTLFSSIEKLHNNTPSCSVQESPLENSPINKNQEQRNTKTHTRKGPSKTKILFKVRL